MTFTIQWDNSKEGGHSDPFIYLVILFDVALPGGLDCGMKIDCATLNVTVHIFLP